MLLLQSSQDAFKLWMVVVNFFGNSATITHCYGKGLVMMQLNVTEVQGNSALRWEYLLFPTLEAAHIYLE